MSQINLLEENLDFYELFKSEILPQIFHHNKSMYRIYQYLGIVPLLLVSIVNFIRPIPHNIAQSKYCSNWDTIAYLFQRLSIAYHIVDTFQIIFDFNPENFVGYFIHHLASLYYLPDLTQQVYCPWSVPFGFVCHALYCLTSDIFGLEVLYFISIIIVYKNISQEKFYNVERFEKPKKIFPVFIISLLLTQSRHIVNYGIEQQDQYLNQNQ